MKKYLVIPALLVFMSCNAGTVENGGKDEAATELKASPADTLANAIFEEASKEGEKKAPPPDTFCYVATEGEQNEIINAVRLIIDSNKVTGELKYITLGEKPAQGQLTGTIKNGIITADWTFIKEKNYYKIPVAFKMTKTSVLQKPSAVNDKGEAYIPEDGEYSYEFPKVGCEYYPR